MSYDAGRRASVGSPVVARKDPEGWRVKCHGCGMERHALNPQAVPRFYAEHRGHRVR